MAVITVAQFAAQLGRPTTALLEQLQSAGVTKQSPDVDAWFTANRMLPAIELLIVTRVSSAVANERIFLASAPHSARVRSCAITRSSRC